MIQWLHKYVFRGIGIAILIGMLTILYLKISWVIQHGAQPGAGRFATANLGSKTMRRRWFVATVVAVISLSLVHPVFAIFGFGDIVFDPSVFAQAVQQVVRLEQQYIQLVETYQMIQNEYEHLRWMAKRVPVDMATRYRAAMTPWQNT